MPKQKVSHQSKFFLKRIKIQKSVDAKENES